MTPIPVTFFAGLWTKVKGLATSRKFWAAIGATVVLVTTAGITPQQLAVGIVTIWGVFIGATALEDGLRGR